MAPIRPRTKQSSSSSQTSERKKEPAINKTVPIPVTGNQARSELMKIKEEFLDDVLETPLVFWDYTPYDTESLPDCDVQASDFILDQPDQKAFEKSVDLDENTDKTDCGQNEISLEELNEEHSCVKKLDNLSVNGQSNNSDENLTLQEGSSEEPDQIEKIEKCVHKRKHSQSFAKGGSVKKSKQIRNKRICLTKNGSKSISENFIYFKPIAEWKGVSTFPNAQMLFNLFGLNILNHQLSKCMWR